MPQINLAFSGVCAPTFDEATRRFRQSSYFSNTFILPNIVGTPEYFRDTLYAYQQSFGVDEFIFLDLSDEHEARMQSLGALSEAFCLQEEMKE
ncbi:MAG: hypothetical protein IPJ82_06025 [Lewinellaceae bacterium]|nr:hypothetical protein [Lewinellaceae bacterium]